jgi:hypothetical protein
MKKIYNAMELFNKTIDAIERSSRGFWNLLPFALCVVLLIDTIYYKPMRYKQIYLKGYENGATDMGDTIVSCLKLYLPLNDTVIDGKDTTITYYPFVRHIRRNSN